LREGFGIVIFTISRNPIWLIEKELKLDWFFFNNATPTLYDGNWKEVKEWKHEMVLLHLHVNAKVYL